MTTETYRGHEIAIGDGVTRKEAHRAIDAKIEAADPYMPGETTPMAGRWLLQPWYYVAFRALRDQWRGGRA